MVVTSLDFGLPSLTLMHESVKKQQEGDISQFLTASLIYAEKKNSREMKMSTTLQKILPICQTKLGRILAGCTLQRSSGEFTAQEKQYPKNQQKLSDMDDKDQSGNECL